MPTIRHLAHSLTIALAGVCLALPATAAAAPPPGTPDTGFGSSGQTVLPAGSRLFAAATQSNGDIVAVGESGAGASADVLLARFTPSGALDQSFGSHGLVEGPAVSGAKGSVARAVAIQPNGQIVTVGYASDATGTSDEGILIERYDSSGALDTSFGSGGVVDELSSDFGSGDSVAIQPNGDILAGGSAFLAGASYATVLRLTPDGHGDPSFTSNAGTGIELLDVGANGVANGLALQSNGDILVAGSISDPHYNQVTDAALVRLKPNGALDSSFAGTGLVYRNYAPSGAYSAFNAVALQSNGDIVAAGNSTDSATDDAFAARFTPAGSLDRSFGSGGVARAPASESAQGSTVPGAFALALAGNGDIVLAGQFAVSGALSDATLWAFTPAGSLDSSFGHGGLTIAPTSSGQGEFAGLVIAPTNGDLVGVGDEGGLSSPYAGLAAAFVGFGAVKPPPPPPPALSVTVSGAPSKLKAAALRSRGVGLTATCNEGCKLSVTLLASAGAARQLHLGHTVRRCRKVHGRRRCRRVTVYRQLTLARAGTTLGAAGRHHFQLRLTKREAKAFARLRRSVTLTLTVLGRSTQTGRVQRVVRHVRIIR